MTRQSRVVRLKVPWRMTETPSFLLVNVPLLTARSLGFAFAGKEEHKKQ